jgi:hypothetical protein
MSFIKFLKENIKESIIESNFQIPIKIQSNFKIKGGLNNYKNWKVKVLLANSAGDEVKKGDWESPRYVMISLDSNNIIPIAISDEHQTGYDLLYEYYYKKKLIKQENYVSIDGNGTTYLYGRPGDTNNLKNDAKKIEAFKKWLSYGGENQPVKSGSGGGYIGDMEDIIERNGNIEIIKGKLAKPGQRIIDTIEKLAKEYNRFLSIEKKYREPNESDIQNFISETLSFIKDIDNSASGPYYGLMGFGRDKNFLTVDKVDKLIKILEIAIKENNYHKAADTLFTFNGIKNLIHNKLRFINKTKKISSYGDESKYLALFGDVELALREFERLGEI